MSETVCATYRRIRIPARELVSFMQSIYTMKREGELRVQFGPGGVPRGTIVWEESVVDTPRVESTRPVSEVAHIPA